MQVIKRDGRAVSYDRSKIIVAIQKAYPMIFGRRLQRFMVQALQC